MPKMTADPAPRESEKPLAAKKARASLPGWLQRKWLYRPDDVARLLGVSARTVRRRMAEGAFGELHQEDSGLRITQSGLLAYLGARKIDPLDKFE